jgi:kynurenine formamidase
LIDYAAWAESTGRHENVSATTRISFEDLQAAYRAQQASSAQPLELRPGDILLIRSGFIKSYDSLTTGAEVEHGTASLMRCTGVDQDVRLLEWLWHNKIAAVGGDAEAWECFPPDESAGFTFHEVLLAGWGCPIAELLCLEDLAEACQKRRKWTFLFTSSPLNIKGGVASPANAMAIL